MCIVLANRLIYYFSKVRKIVRDHASNIDRNRNLSEKELKNRKLVEFNRPELIWTQDSADKVFPSTYMNNPITFAGITEFLNENRRWIKQEKLTEYPEFDPTGTNDNPPAMVELIHEMGHFDADIIDFDDQFSEESLNTELVFSIVVNRTSGHIVVIFRGSYSVWDFRYNLNFFRSTHPLVKEVTDNGAMVHRGFLSTYLSHCKA